MKARLAYLAIAAALLGGEAVALTLTECDRTTHISHGGEADHRDLGEGRVMWRDWWGREGAAASFARVECMRGAALGGRGQGEGVGARLPFDKTNKALAILERHENGARAFATFERIAADLKGTARDITITALDAEPCACAALYPEARGDKTEFMLAG